MTSGRERWRENWRAVAPPEAVRIKLGAFGSRPDIEQLGVFRPGTPIVISTSAPGATRRCRAFASRAGIRVDREYLAFPSGETPSYLVEDKRATVRFFLERVLVPPPRPAFALTIAAAVRALRGIVPWWAIRLIAPGRMVVGRWM